MERSGREAATIAAVSTAYGEGGIGIVRISGERAGEILRRLFVRAGQSGGDEDAPGIPEFEDRRMYHGYVRAPGTGEVIDEALFVLMRAPRSYTGEDVAEIQCHGSVVSLRRILEAALGCGAEPSSPGEFTQRAFLNGRIDLAQAEAVIDVIRAKTEQSAAAAVAQLEGGLSTRVGEVRSLLADALALAVVHIDYPDDDKDVTDPDSAQSEMTAGLRAAGDLIEGLIATAHTGRILREGLNVVIAGAANAGKSSLMNALLKDARAIVTDIPGTTRDSIEENANIRGVPVRLTDTAGVRDTKNEIEKLGIDRAREAIRVADLVVFLVDGGKKTDEDDVTALRLAAGVGSADADGASVLSKLILAISKSDLPRVVTDSDIEKLLRDAGVARGHKKNRPLCVPISLSVMTGEGLDDLERAIERAVYGGKAPQADEPLVTNVRHRDLLVRAAAEIASGTDMLSQTGDIDLAETNIRAAYEYLGEITGETATDDIMGRIFSRFCIGK
jgi:tRNA modification GTPase